MALPCIESLDYYIFRHDVNQTDKKQLHWQFYKPHQFVYIHTFNKLTGNKYPMVIVIC